MFEKLIDADERGQVGIETLIIFIAMILVAAVAAGVLINTAGFLQNQAKATSEDSTQQVSNQIIVTSAIGDVNSAGDNITSLNFTVMQSPGADEIDLEAATIEWIGPDGHATLVYESGNSPGVGNFSVYEAKGGTAPVLDSQEDRFVIDIPLNGSSNVQNLSEGEDATVRFVTQAGSTYTYVVNVPESLASDSDSAVEV